MIDISQNNKKLYSPVDLAINPVFNAIQKDGALSSERSLFDNLIYNFVEVMDSFYSFNISMAHFVLVNKGLFIVQGLISLAIAILVLFGKRDPKTNKLELNIRANLTNLSASSYEVIGYLMLLIYLIFLSIFSI